MRAAGAPQGWTLIALGTLPTLAIAALVPVLPALFGRYAGEPGAQWLVPMILTVPSLCVALFSGAIGAAADRWGRRRILLGALLVYGSFGLAPFLFEDLHAVIGSRVGVGLAEAAVLTIGNSLMGDYFAGEARQKWLGLQVSLGPFVGTGYLLAGGALGKSSWHGPFVLYLLGLVVLAFAWFTLYEPEAAHDAPAGLPAPATRFPWGQTILVGAVTLLVSVIYFLQAVQHGNIFAALGVQGSDRISWVVSLASLGTVLGGVVFRRIGAWRVTGLMAIVFACYGISYVGLAHAPGWISGMAIDAVGQFAGGLGLAVLIGWAIASYDFEHRGRGMGIWAACFFLGQFLSPPVVTLLGRLTPGFLPSVGSLGVIALACALVALALRLRPVGPRGARRAIVT